MSTDGSPATRPTIAAPEAASLFRWNASLGVLHALQALLMLVISFAKDPLVTVPVVSSYLAWDPASATLVPDQRPLFELPVGPAVAAFFLASAIAHFTLAFPARGWYERILARGMNPARWIEYAISSSIMIVIIAELSGIQEVGTLIALFGVNAAMNLFGWSMEAANEGRADVDWKHFLFGCVAGSVPWIVIAVALWTSATAPEAAAIPLFVWIIFGSLFVSFNVFAITMVLQYRRMGRWADYLVGERTYMFLSLFAKTILAWQVFAGTLRP